MITTQTGILVALIGLFGGVLGAIISYIALKSSARISATPDLIRAYGERLDAAEKKIEGLVKKQKGLEKEVGGWKRRYFKLLKWLEDFFKKNGINEVIPEFHKESE